MAKEFVYIVTENMELSINSVATVHMSLAVDIFRKCYNHVRKKPLPDDIYYEMKQEIVRDIHKTRNALPPEWHRNKLTVFDREDGSYVMQYDDMEIICMTSKFTLD